MRTEEEIRRCLQSVEFLYDMAHSLEDGCVTKVDLEKNKTMICTLKWVLGEEDRNVA